MVPLKAGSWIIFIPNSNQPKGKYLYIPILSSNGGKQDEKSDERVSCSGYPIYSHQADFIDFSSYEGSQNVRMVRQKGQIYKAKVLKGLTDVPASWGVPDSNFISTEIDMSRFEIKNSFGLQVNNSNKMFMLKCVL